MFLIAAIALKGIVASVNLGATDGLTFKAFVIQHLPHLWQELAWYGITAYSSSTRD